MINSIVVKDLEIDCVVGVPDWERQNPQTIKIDIKAFFDTTAVDRSQSIRDTVDYLKVTQIAEKVAKSGPYKLLETMAVDIGKALFEALPILSIEFTLKKISPDVPNSRWVGISYRMGRQSMVPLRVADDSVSNATSKNRYNQRVALISGSVQGLGKAFAEHLGHQGCSVGIHYRSNDKNAQALVEHFQDADIKSKAFQADFNQTGDIEKMAHNVLEAFGAVDFLVNNVGAYSNKGLFEMETREFENIIQTNICGTYTLTREILPAMRKKGFGRVINIGQASAERIRAHKTETPYQISKTAVLTLTKSIAALEAQNGITCNMISPGILVNNVNYHPNISHNIPAGRLGEFKDLIGALDYFLSPEGDYVTGTAIDVTGGYGL